MSTVDSIYPWTHALKTCFHVTSNVWVSGVKLWSFPAQIWSSLCRVGGRDPFNQNFRKFWSKTQWIGSVQPEKFRKNWSTFWGGPLFPVGPVWILVEWIAPGVLVVHSVLLTIHRQRGQEITEKSAKIFSLKWRAKKVSRTSSENWIKI